MGLFGFDKWARNKQFPNHSRKGTDDPFQSPRLKKELHPFQLGLLGTVIFQPMIRLDLSERLTSWRWHQLDSSLLAHVLSKAKLETFKLFFVQFGPCTVQEETNGCFCFLSGTMKTWKPLGCEPACEQGILFKHSGGSIRHFSRAFQLHNKWTAQKAVAVTPSGAFRILAISPFPFLRVLGSLFTRVRVSKRKSTCCGSPLTPLIPMLRHARELKELAAVEWVIFGIFGTGIHSGGPCHSDLGPSK